jgi:Tol biopolymer transport system component
MISQLSPKEIASVVLINGLALNRDGSRVVYCVGTKYTSGEHSTSSLWSADMNKEESTKQITTGDFHDRNPIFHPTKPVIFFLSDRPKAGGPTQIYSIPSDEDSKAKPTAITSVAHKQGVSSFKISPDGRYVAFVSIDDSESERSEDEPEVWGEPINLGRLRVIDLDNVGAG